MNLRKVVADLGNSLWKIRIGDREFVIPNALLEISESEYNKAKRMNGNKLPSTYVIINDKYYVIGEKAEDYGVIRPQTGAAKYTKDYYGIGLAAMMAQIIKVSTEVICYLAYPPGNVNHVIALNDSVLSRYEITIEDRSFVIEVKYVYLFVEPVGGVMNILLTREGVLRQKHDLKNGRILSVDFGGGTTDFSAMFPDGELDGSIQHSVPTGINVIYSGISSELEKEYSSELRGAAGLPMRKLREALKTGTLNLKGTPRNCLDIVRKEKNKFLNLFNDGYMLHANGGVNADLIVLTGAGYVDIFDDVVEVLGFNPEFVFKAEDDEFAHMANARGGANQLIMFERNGIITYE